MDPLRRSSDYAVLLGLHVEVAENKSNSFNGSIGKGFSELGSDCRKRIAGQAKFVEPRPDLRYRQNVR